MNVHTIEIAAAIEEELTKFLSEWGGGYPMKFTRFIDLGGKQTDLYVYTAVADVPPWMIIRIKSVFKTDQGECIQYFVNINGDEKTMEDVMVSPEIWKLPALADKILNFSRSDMLMRIGDGGAIEESDSGNAFQSSSSDDDEDLDDVDLSGILAGDGDSDAGGMDFNPEDMIAAANSEGGDDDVDPSDLIKQMNEEGGGDDESPSGFNPDDVIQD